MERHDLDPISLVFGITFIALGLVFFAGPVSLKIWQWVFPLLAIGLGLGLLYSARRTRDRVDSRPGSEPELG
jgi:hypothetical protein